jgi:16S rRNA (guanine966-N2)-methyltransferase
VRVIAGERKGFRLDAPRGEETRPTSDRLREALFSILGGVDDLAVLDAFAGSGALGLEALSRGAGTADFCDTQAAALRALRDNIERLGYRDRARVRRQDARRRMAADHDAGITYELILIDPPYRMLPALQKHFALHLPALLVPDGLVTIESPGAAGPLDLPLAIETTRLHGDVRLTVYRNA